MKSRAANIVLVVILLASTVLFWVCFKPLLDDSPVITELTLIPEGPMQEVFQGQVARLPHLLVAFCILLLFGYRRKDLFLTKGDFSTGAEGFKMFGIKDGESWRKIGLTIGAWVVGITLVFSFVSLRPSITNIGEALRHTPFIVLNASMNAFYEEFIFRAALIPPLLAIAGKTKTIWLTSILFGAGHLVGSNLSGTVFAIMAFYLGLLLAKSMIETKGILFAFGLHCVLDIVIFFTMVMHAQT